MPLKLTNTLTKKKEVFKPLRDKKVKMYTCGPTVYSTAHIGNFSSYIMSDLVYRYLTYKGYTVTKVENITDVGHLVHDEDEGEDKIAKAAREQNKSPYEIARFYTKQYFIDRDLLRIHKPDVQAYASKHIPEMIQCIEALLMKGVAYEEKGDVFFDISSFKNYGKLSGNTLKDLKAGARISVHKGKKSPFDFHLWRKASKNHIMQWDSPWGKGYPGWHIECSVMIRKHLGDQIDIHTGGEDNIFPHHEDEIAQSESLSGKKFVRYWLHRQHTLVNDNKMSKSLNNFITLSELQKKGWSPITYRFLVLSSHYRSKLRFSEASLHQAQSSLDRIREFLTRIQGVALSKVTSQQEKNTSIHIQSFKNNVIAALDNDLNVPLAFSHIFEFITKINKAIDKGQIDAQDAQKIHDLFHEFDQIFAVFHSDTIIVDNQMIDRLVKKRDHAREKKDFKTADSLRKQLEEMNIILQDSPSGTKWKKRI